MTTPEPETAPSKSSPDRLAFLQRPVWRRALLALFALMLVVISYLALSPAPPAQLDLGWDKLNHLCAFGGLCLVGRLAWPGHRLHLLAALFAYGGAIEILQSQVPGRSADWADLLADSVGLALGLVLTWALQRAARVRWRPQQTPAAREMG